MGRGLAAFRCGLRARPLVWPDLVARRPGTPGGVKGRLKRGGSFARRRLAPLHGSMFLELKRFAEVRWGPGGWTALLDAAGFPHRVYLATADHPDPEFAALVAAVARRTGITKAAAEREFGRYVGPEFIRMYAHFFRPEWRTLDVVERTGDLIHRSVGSAGAGKWPGAIRTSRSGENEVSVIVHLPEERCDLSAGIIEGIAAHFRERIEVVQVSCRARGDAQCEMRARTS